MVRVFWGNEIPLPPFYLNFTPLLPQFHLFFTSFLPLFILNLTSASSRISNHGLESTVYRLLAPERTEKTSTHYASWGPAFSGTPRNLDNQRPQILDRQLNNSKRPALGAHPPRNGNQWPRKGNGPPCNRNRKSFSSSKMPYLQRLP